MKTRAFFFNDYYYDINDNCVFLEMEMKAIMILIITQKLI